MTHRFAIQQRGFLGTILAGGVLALLSAGEFALGPP